MRLCTIEGGAGASGSRKGRIEILNQMGRVDGETYTGEEGLIIFDQVTNNNPNDTTNYPKRWKTIAENIEIKNYSFICIKTVYYPISDGHVYSTEDVFLNDTDTNIRLRNAFSMYNNVSADGAETPVGSNHTITTTNFFPVSSYSDLGTIDIKLRGNSGYNGNKRIGFSKIIVYGVKGEIEE